MSRVESRDAVRRHRTAAYDLALQAQLSVSSDRHEVHYGAITYLPFIGNRSTRSLCRLPPMILGSPTVCRLSLCVTVPCAHRSSTMSSCTEPMVFILATKEQSCCRSTFIYQVLIDDCRAGSATDALGFDDDPPRAAFWKDGLGTLGNAHWPQCHVRAP